MPSDMGFAVVGLGMGTHHCKAIEETTGAFLAAVCDLDDERREPVAEEYDCRSYADYDQLLADDEIRAVCIATPSATHAELGIEAANAGKHLIVEKPADIVTDRIDALMEAGEKNGVKITVFFQARFHPLNIRIRQAIQEGRLGKLIGIHGHLPWYRQQVYYDGPHGEWKGTWQMDGGGSLMNQGIHTMDLLLWFGGKVESVAGMYDVFGHDIEAEDQTVALMRFSNGALGTMYATTCCYSGFDQRITIYGSKGAIVKEEGKLVSWKMAGDEDGSEEREVIQLFGQHGDTAAADPMAAAFDGHTQIVADLMESIRDQREPAIDLASTRHSVEIINAIYEASQKGSEVKLEDNT